MKNRLIIFLLFAAFISSSQKYGNIWYFGKDAGIDFNTCTPVALTNGKNAGFEGCATVCNSNGVMLFYTNSDQVWNASHQVMPNGNINNSSGTLSQVLIVPTPSNSLQYFIFTTKIQGSGSLTFQYHHVDMSLQGGLGDVISKNNSLSSLVITEQVAATMHSNGTDIWVMTHEYATNNFMCYLVSSTGVAATPVVSAVGPAHVPCTSQFNARGEIKFSPNGLKLAINGNGIGGTGNDNTNLLCLLDFNKSTGMVSNPINLPFLRGDFGLSFSADNSKLYGATWKAFSFTLSDYNYLYQYDLSSGNPTSIIASKLKIDSSTATSTYGSLKLGPDKKIYVTRANSTFLGVINSPNIAGFGCNYVANGFSLGGKACTYGLNNYIEYETYCVDNLSSLSEDFLGKEVSVYPNPMKELVTIRFTNPASSSFKGEIYDCSGVLVRRIPEICSESLVIGKEDLPAGIYFLRLSGSSKTFTSKLVVE